MKSCFSFIKYYSLCHEFHVFQFVFFFFLSFCFHTKNLIRNLNDSSAHFSPTEFHKHLVTQRPPLLLYTLQLTAKRFFLFFFSLVILSMRVILLRIFQLCHPLPQDKFDNPFYKTIPSLSRRRKFGHYHAVLLYDILNDLLLNRLYIHQFYVVVHTLARTG